MYWSLAFLIAALVLFILSAIGVGGGQEPRWRVNLTSAGLACLTASMLVRV